MSWKFKDFDFPLGKKTYIMGILNVTPDSFSDGGKYNTTAKAVEHAMEMVAQGADIIDIGAQSTKPNHVEISSQEEWSRLENILREIRSKTNCPISIDTYFTDVAQKALEAGADIINDVSGVFSEEMALIVKEYNAGWVIMHTGGGNADVTVPIDDIVKDVQVFFEKALHFAQRCGIKREQICLDMGIGFGKTYEQNLLLLREHKNLKVDEIAMLTGISRKRVVGIATQIEEPEKRIYGNISGSSAAIYGQTDVLRVHDVFAEKQGAMMADAIFRRGD